MKSATKLDYMRLAHQDCHPEPFGFAQDNSVKGLAERFFATLRMTLLMGLRYKVYQCPELWFRK